MERVARREPMGGLALRQILQLPPPLLLALVPWWCGLILMGSALLQGRPGYALAVSAGCLLYSTAIVAGVLLRDARTEA